MDNPDVDNVNLAGLFEEAPQERDDPNVVVPDVRELRHRRRNFDRSARRFNYYLQNATPDLLDNEIREQSLLHASLNNAMDDSREYIEALTIILRFLPPERELERNTHERSLRAAQEINASIPGRYADKLQELTAQVDDASIPGSVHNSVHSNVYIHEPIHENPINEDRRTLGSGSHRQSNSVVSSQHRSSHRSQRTNSESRHSTVFSHARSHSSRRTSSNSRSTITSRRSSQESRRTAYSSIHSVGGSSISRSEILDRLEEMDLEDEYEENRLRRQKEKLRLKRLLKDGESMHSSQNSNYSPDKQKPESVRTSRRRSPSLTGSASDLNDMQHAKARSKNKKVDYATKIKENHGRSTAESEHSDNSDKKHRKLSTRYNHDFNIDTLISGAGHSPEASGMDKFLHSKTLERSGFVFDGDYRKYTSFRNQFNQIIKRFSHDIPYLVDELLAMVSKDALKHIEHIRDLLDDPLHALQTGLTILKRNFGSDYEVRQAHMKVLTDQTKRITWDATSLRNLLSDLEKCKALLRQPKNRVYLNSPETVFSIVSRLPDAMQHAFGRACIKEETKDPEFDSNNPGFDFVILFIEGQHREANLPCSKMLQENKKQKNQKKSNPINTYGPKRSNISAVQLDTSSTHLEGNNHIDQNASCSSVNRSPGMKINNQLSVSRKCHCCRSVNHRLQRCPDFGLKTLSERWQFVESNANVCQQCFGSHLKSSCRSTYSCRECGKKDHHTMLCRNPRQTTEIAPEDSTGNDFNKSTSHVSSTSATAHDAPVYVRVVPLSITSSSGSTAMIYALLDSGSNKTICTVRLAQLLQLNLATKPGCKLNLEGVHGVKEINAKEISFSIRGTGDNCKKFSIENVPCVRTLPSHVRSLPSSSITKQHPHLADIKFPAVSEEGIDLIIGTDNELLHQVIESRVSPDSKLYGYLTPLGWVLSGNDDKAISVSAIRVTSTSCIYDWKGKDQYSNYYPQNINDLTLSAVQEMMHKCVEKPGDEKLAPSVEDERVIEMFVNEKRKTDDNHFVLPLPFRDRTCKIPNNRSMAEARLNSLRRQLKKDKELHQFYVTKMRDTINKGYLLKVKPLQKVKYPDRVVYLPHFPTRQIKKRIVIDAAATHLGTCFNSLLMQGPDLMQSLVDIVVRFRQNSIAFACDIKEMFHQVKIPEEDQSSIRLLWFKDDNIDAPPEEYQFTVHAFGWKSSPAAANFAIRQTALDNECGVSQGTVNLILHQLYVDDCLNSEASVEAAISRATELNKLADTSGFKFVKYLSNSPEFLKAINEELLIPEIREIGIDYAVLPTKKALGVFWNPSNDRLVIKINIKTMPMTKRGILSMLHQIFDPLGLTVPYLISGRRILQEAFLCTEQDDWDTLLPDNLCRRWSRWLNSLGSLEEISVPRCYHIDGDNPSYYELHTFADASNVGMGAVTYLRFQKDGVWNCSFVRGKGHILPKGTNWSVARYELEAAVMAAELHRELLDALDLVVNKSALWSDSATVLSWLANTTRRPKVFVYNRKREILRNTDASQWNYVNTLCNPADLATRNRSPAKASTDYLWISGPKFLYLEEDKWPLWEIPQAIGFDAEMVPRSKAGCYVNALCCSAARVATSEMVKPASSAQGKLFNLLWKYSCLDKLLRILAWLARLSYKHKEQVRTNFIPISQSELSDSLMTAVWLAQLEYFTPAVLDSIHSHGFNYTMDGCQDKSVKDKLKKLCKLCPFIDDQHLLRVGGRLQNSDVPDSLKHPVILPRRHHITRLIIEDVHCRNRHFGGISFVLNQLQLKFCIGSSTVKFYLDRCLPCLQIRAQTGNQIMAPLPAARVTTGGQPFHTTGVDYFGPVLTKVLRSHVKRWIALFTCLATRAIHLEKVNSLTTSSFLQAFFRFRCSRGNTVKTLYSDNASTFHGADTELKQALERLEAEGFGRKLQHNGVDWKFNPPLASHQGGVWERLIRSVRKVLLGIPALQNREPTDETLDTYLKEAESIVNLRPLTKLNGDPEELPALTPSMLLTGSLAPTLPVDVFHTSDQLKNDWRYTQIAAQQFWERFIKEYLVNLQPRHKWYRSSPDFKVGDIVLVKEARVNYRPQYPKAMVISLHPGADGNTRSVKVRFADGRILVRDIRKLVPLEGHVHDDEAQSS